MATVEQTTVSVEHVSPGRVRLKVGRLKKSQRYAQEVEQSLKSTHSVREVSVTPDIGSLTVHFDSLTTPSAIQWRSIASALGVTPHQFEEIGRAHV